MAIIPKDQIDQIEKNADIVRLAGAHTSLKPSGNSFIGLCPFHKEKTPSFVVSPAKNRFHCYGCDRSGGPISFLMEAERYGFMEALEKLAADLGISLNTQSAKRKPDREDDEYQKCMLFARGIFSDGLKNNRAAADYLKQRGFDGETANRFELGFAVNSWDRLHGILNKAGFSAEIQMKSGLIRKKKTGGYYDFLRNRIVFPIRGETGKYLGFSGRLLSGEGAKYVNPPETEIYKKTSVLYGIHLAAPFFRKKRRAILVEGYFDVTRLHEKGFGESVACCGTALTQDHLRTLRKFRPEKLITLFDGDAAGESAALKTSKMCLVKNFEGNVCLLPEGTDPDDFLANHPPEELEKRIDASPNFTEFVLNHARKEAQKGGLETQKKVIQSLLDLGAEIEGKLEQELWKNAVSKTFDLSVKALNFPSGKQTKREAEKIEIQTGIGLENLKKEERIFSKDFHILRLLVLHPFFINFAREHCNADVFSTQYQKDLAAKLFNLNPDECKAIRSEILADSFPEQRHLLHYLFETATKRQSTEFDENDFKSHLRGFLKRKFVESRKNDLSLATEETEKEIILYWKKKIESLNDLTPAG